MFTCDIPKAKIMKRTLMLIVVICALLASALYAFADIPKPKQSPAEPKPVFYTGLIGSSDPKGYDARLIISEDTLKNIQDAAARRANASLGQKIMHSSTRTIMAGTFMFLAI